MKKAVNALSLSSYKKSHQDFLKKYIKSNVRGPYSQGSQKIEPGRMYTFKYEAKIAEFWDKYPVTIIIDVQSKHFLGLSIHYFPPKVREVFITKLLLYNAKLLEAGKPCKIDYEMLKDVTNMFYKEGILIIRKYLKSHVRSRIEEINYKEWLNVVSSRGNGIWMNITAAKVWSEYKDKLRGLYTGKKTGFTERGIKKRVAKGIPIKGYNVPKMKKRK